PPSEPDLDVAARPPVLSIERHEGAHGADAVAAAERLDHHLDALSGEAGLAVRDLEVTQLELPGRHAQVVQALEGHLLEEGGVHQRVDVTIAVRVRQPE